MSDHWDVYFTSIEEQFASVLLDMGIIEEAPDDARPWLLRVRIALNQPDENGMIVGDEFESISVLEDALSEELVSIDAVHVGCVTTAGRRELSFYAPSDSGFQATVDRIMQSVGTHRWQCAAKQDPDWEYYIRGIYPDAYDQQTMGNRKVLEALAEHGDIHERERTVSHWAYFSRQENRATFVDEIQKLGFTIVDQPDSDSPEDNTPFGISFERTDPVDWGSINNLTIQLLELAYESDGNYDGWETVIVTE